MKYDGVELEVLPLFRGLPQDDLQLLGGLFVHRSFPDGDIIFTQGEPADHLYVLLTGKVSIRFKPHDGDLLEVTSIGEGGVFGWSAALGRQAYTSLAVACGECSALSIRGEVLRQLCKTKPEIGVVILGRMAEIIANRLDHTRQMVTDLLWKGVSDSTDREQS